MVSREKAIDRLKRDNVVSEDLVTELFGGIGVDREDLKKGFGKCEEEQTLYES